MAIKAPTPPTPPTVPVVPGTEQQSDVGQTQQTGQSAGNGQDNGREFGVHVTISNPKENNGAAAAQQGITGNGQGSEAQSNRQTGQNNEQSQMAQSDVAQQARQDMVQQALGMKDEDAAKQGQTTQQNVVESPWPLSGSHISAMSFMPVLIVFVAAFITFMLRNLSKKPRLSQKPPAKGKGQPPAQNVYREKSTAKNEKKNKGSHFEMRI